MPALAGSHAPGSCRCGCPIRRAWPALVPFVRPCHGLARGREGARTDLFPIRRLRLGAKGFVPPPGAHPPSTGALLGVRTSPPPPARDPGQGGQEQQKGHAACTVALDLCWGREVRGHLPGGGAGAALKPAALSCFHRERQGWALATRAGAGGCSLHAVSCAGATRPGTCHRPESPTHQR